MTEIIFKLYCRNKAYIIRIIKSALELFNIKKKIKTLILERDDKIGDDVNMNYSCWKQGKIVISFGRNYKITRRLIFHELGHAWDAVYNDLDFSKEKLSKRQQIIGGIIVNLSLDGRLEKKDLPHISKTDRYRFFTHTNKKFNIGLAKNDFFRFWGANLKKKDVMKILNKHK